MNTLLAAGLALAALTAACPATAADMGPVYKASPAAVASNGFYFWADGAWQGVNLPEVNLSYHNMAAGSLADLGPVSAIGTHVDGLGVRGALGYILPPGGYANVLGSNLRFEIGARYVSANGMQTSSVTSAPNIVQDLLNGTVPNFGFNCTPGTFTCTVGATLHTDFQKWEINSRIATDYRVGSVKLTPSIAIFGGQDRNDQTLSQSFTDIFNTTGTVVKFGSYSANMALHWTDFGARAGLEVGAPLTDWLSVGAGGSVGFARRDNSLAASDTGVGFGTGGSVIAANASTTAFVANVEAGLSIRPWATRDVTFRAFGGVDLDNRVPGLTAPSYSGPVNAQTGTTPAGLAFFGESTVYAGAGALMRF